jgi:hypothetical protein
MGKIIAKLVGSLLAVAATAGIGFSRINLPDEKFWKDHPYRLATAVAWLAVWSVWDSVDRALAAQRANSERRYLERLREGERALAAALPLIWRDSGVEDPTLLGLHGFFVRRRWRFPRWPWRYPVQAHDIRVRMGDIAPTTNDSFEEGVGVVGRCWSERRYVRVNLARSLRNYKKASRQEWNSLPEDTRLGLSYTALKRTLEDPKAIFAAPMVTNGDYVGCVTLDAPPEYYTRLDVMHVRRLLELAANTVKHAVTD